jgi:hypothetical protein
MNGHPDTFLTDFVILPNGTLFATTDDNRICTTEAYVGAWSCIIGEFLGGRDGPGSGEVLNFPRYKYNFHILKKTGKYVTNAA